MENSKIRHAIQELDFRSGSPLRVVKIKIHVVLREIVC